MTKIKDIFSTKDFNPVLYDEDKYGKFHTGDSYIVLNTREGRAGHFAWDVHFWLGAETSQVKIPNIFTTVNSRYNTVKQY